MATEIIYKVAYNGEYLDPDGNRVLSGDSDAAQFLTLEDTSAFIEASGSNDGTYFIYTCAIKATPLPSGSGE